MTLRKPKRKAHRARLRSLRMELRGTLKERESLIDGVLSALVAGEHVFVGGPPGTAKTMIAEYVNNAITDASYYYWLLTKFSTPEELFGPFSMSGLKADRFERVIDHKLPTAHVAFLDECFKANSAILNALLTLINERRFHNGVNVISCPLVMMIGASNELPQGAELEALFDRFLLRYWVQPIVDRSKLLEMMTEPQAAPTTTLTLADLGRLRRETDAIPFSDEMVELLLDTKSAVEREGFSASDRRWKKTMGVMRGYALVSGDSAVTEEHFDLLADMLWREPQHRPALAKVISKLANPAGAAAVELLDAAKQVYRTIPLTSSRKEIRDEGKSNEVTALIIEANTVFTESTEKLEALNGGSRQVTEAIKEIARMHKSTSRFAAKLQGLRLR